MGGTKKPKGASGAPPWPDFEFQQDPTLRRHAKNLLKEIIKVEEHAKDVNQTPPLELFSGMVQAVKEVLQRIKDEPSVSSMTQELQEIRSILQNQKEGQEQANKQLNTITNQTNRFTAVICGPRMASGAGSYRDAALRGHVTSTESSLVSGWQRRIPSTLSPVASNGLSSGSSAAAPYPLPENLEIHVRGTTESVVNPLRRDEQKLVDRANQAILQSEIQAITQRQLSSGRVLPSGDVLLQADNLEDVEQLTRYSMWVKAFGEEAKIRKPTYAVVMHKVSAGKVDAASQANIKAQLKADNAGRLASTPADITYVGWLFGARKVREEGLERSELVVEFDDDRPANLAIQRGLVLHGRNHTCTIYDRHQRVRQCFNCQAYGHIAKHCKRLARCAYCGESHKTEDCDHPKDKTRACCAVCKDAAKGTRKEEDWKHFAFARECPERQTRVAIARDNRVNGPQFYAPRSRSEAALAGELSGDSASDPTPAEASTARSRPSTRPTQSTQSSRSKSRAPTTRNRSKSAGQAEAQLSRKRPRTNKDKESEMDKDLRAEQPAEGGALRPVEINTVDSIIYERPGRSQRRITTQKDIFVSDIVPNTPTAEALGAVDRVPRRQSAREDPESEDELSGDHNMENIS